MTWWPAARSLEVAAALTVLALTALTVRDLVRARPRVPPTLVGPLVATAVTLGVVAHGLRGGGATRALVLAGLGAAFVALTWAGHARRLR